MKKSLLFLILIVSFVMVGCTDELQVSEPLQDSAEESQQIETNNSTNVTTQEVIVTKPVIQKTEVQKLKCSREFSPKFNAKSYYRGPLFDAHLHMPPNYEEEPESLIGDRFPIGFRMPVLGKEIVLDDILCLFDKEKVSGAFAFYQWNYENLEQSIQYAANMKKQLPAGIHLFLSPLELEAEKLDAIITSHPGVFDGFGEIVFYDPERSSATPNDQGSLEIYNVAEEHNIVIMFHPDAGQETKIEDALKKNPNVKFLLHGPEIENSITNLMGKYPNVYYSIDTILIRVPNRGPLMYMASSKEEYKRELTQNFDVMLNDAVNKWKNRIEKHPDRFMWGTDRAGDWSFDEETSILIEEFTRVFIGQLDSAVQEKYAYKNAEKLL